MLSNLASPFFIYDVFLGSLATLLATLITYLVGRYVKKEPFRVILAGLPPVLLNALIIPVIIVFLCGGGEGFASTQIAYFSYALSLLLTESVWIYGLGVPTYFYLKRLRERGKVSFLI